MRRMLVGVALATLAAASGCSANRLLADALGSQNTDVFASDDDPELVRDALPLALKVMESAARSVPDHEPIRLALVSGFTQYAYGFVQLDAERREAADFTAHRAGMLRARKLYQRALRYGLEGLELAYPGFGRDLAADRTKALARVKKDRISLLYWTGMALAASINADRANPSALIRLPEAEAMLRRVLALDETFDEGAAHEFFITFAMLTPEAQGGGEAVARKHFARAVELSWGAKAAPYVALAEAVAVTNQDRDEFVALLNQALAIDPDAVVRHRLVNILMQRRARELLARADELIL